MTTKGIEFKVSIDAKEANKQIQEIQKRLQEMQKNQSYQDRAKAQAGGAGGPQDERIQKVFREHQERLLAISKENLTLAQKSLDYKQKLIEKVQALAQAEGTSVEKKKQAQEVLNKLKEQELATARKIVEETDIQSKAGGSAAGGGANPPADGGVGTNIFKGAIKTFLARELSNIVQGAANLTASTLFEGAQNKSRQQAGVVRGSAQMSGADLILSGRGAEATLYQNERRQALTEALDAQGAITTRGLGSMAGSAIGYAGIGAGIGGTLGGMAGFAAGGVGAIPGAAAGAKLGGMAGAGFGAIKNLFSEGQSGAYIKGMLTPGDSGSEAVERLRAQTLVDNYEQNLEANKTKNYRRTKAMEFMEGNRDKFIQAQQTMGLNDQGTFGMLNDTSRGQFTIDQTLGAAGAIAGAGGSTAQMRNANQANELQRDYGLQNAAGITGLLSKQIGGGKGVSDEVTKKLLADAFSVGLDASNFSRETEKFVSMSAKFVAQSGAETSEAQKAIAGLMGNYVTGDSMQRIEAGEGAREEVERKTSGKGTSYEKMLQFSSARREGLGRQDATALMKMTKEQIMVGGAVIDDMVARTGKSPEELLQVKKQMGDTAFTKTGAEEKLFETYKSTTSAAAKLMPKGTQVSNYNDLKAAYEAEADPDKKKVLGEALTATQRIQGFRAGNEGELVQTPAEAEARLKGEAGYTTKRDLTADAPKLEVTAAQKAREADATSEKAQLDNAKTYLKDYSESVGSIAKVSKEMLLALDEFTNAVKNKASNLEDVAIKVNKQQEAEARQGSASRNRSNNVAPRGSSGGF